MSLAIRIGLGLKIPCIWIFPTNMFLFSCGLAASPCVHTRVCSSPYLQVPLPLSRASIANVLNFSRKIFPVLQHSCILYVPRSVNLRFYTSAELGTINLSSKGSPATNERWECHYATRKQSDIRLDIPPKKLFFVSKLKAIKAGILFLYLPT